jgi:hypothetical protein
VCFLCCCCCCCCSFASAAGPVEVFRHNIFIPHQHLKGKFNKVGQAAPQYSDAVDFVV